MEKLPEFMQYILKHGSGNTAAGWLLALEALEEVVRKYPHGDLIPIRRTKMANERLGSNIIPTCRTCGYEGNLRRITEHVLYFHLKLRLWRCTYW